MRTSSALRTTTEHRAWRGAGALVALALLLAPTAGLAAPAAPARAYQPLASGSLVEDKDFYLLTLLSGLPQARAALLSDPQLRAEAERRRASLAANERQLQLHRYLELAIAAIFPVLHHTFSIGWEVVPGAAFVTQSRLACSGFRCTPARRTVLRTWPMAVGWKVEWYGRSERNMHRL